MRKRLQLLGVGLLLLASTSCGKSEAGAENGKGSEAVVSDSVAAAEAKKKAQEAEKAKLEKPYHPEDDANAVIEGLIAKAKAENKTIILQAGGNWCIWCLRFHDFVQKTPELKKIVDDHYLYYHLNYSPENKNEAVFARYGDPGKHYGYPVFIVLDKNGKHIHTQESGSLESGKSYDIEKVKAFFEAWKS
ncbi:thioredoxin family protein [Bergeyella sp. RCAD1439]|uniref:thioredoxin family protein n=1 Tax=Bergeyella anatis TaxID=3113737 RepID=UPI002E190F83|nr:thioredoxin family protein [Bergeyella sp. RCAD1439]